MNRADDLHFAQVDEHFYPLLTQSFSAACDVFDYSFLESFPLVFPHHDSQLGHQLSQRQPSLSLLSSLPILFYLLPVTYGFELGPHP